MWIVQLVYGVLSVVVCAMWSSNALDGCLLVLC